MGKCSNQASELAEEYASAGYLSQEILEKFRALSAKVSSQVDSDPTKTTSAGNYNIRQHALAYRIQPEVKVDHSLASSPKWINTNMADHVERLPLSWYTECPVSPSLTTSKDESAEEEPSIKEAPQC